MNKTSTNKSNMNKEYTTEIISCDTSAISKAAELLKKGEVVAIPTETVYGLAANAYDSDAVKKIFTVKGRPQDNPLIVHVADKSDIYPLVKEVSDNAEKLMNAFWPGPLTLVFKSSGSLPAEISAGLDTLAVRMPLNKVARDIIKAAATPLAAPSANLSGSPSPTFAHHVYHDFKGKIPLIIDGGGCDVGVESTVLDVTGAVPVLLRPGGVSLDDLKTVLEDVSVSGAVLKEIDKNEKVLSPGMKYRHYAPKAGLVLLDGSADSIKAYLDKQAYLDKHTCLDKQTCLNNLPENKLNKTFVGKLNKTLVIAFEGETNGLKFPFYTFGKRTDFKEQAKNIFRLLRLADEQGYERVYCSLPRPDGVGLAVYNRLIRAAEFNIVTLDN